MSHKAISFLFGRSIIGRDRGFYIVSAWAAVLAIPAFLIGSVLPEEFANVMGLAVFWLLTALALPVALVMAVCLVWVLVNKETRTQILQAVSSRMDKIDREIIERRAAQGVISTKGLQPTGGEVRVAANAANDDSADRPLR